jgi:hypothetical protein
MVLSSERVLRITAAAAESPACVGLVSAASGWRLICTTYERSIARKPHSRVAAGFPAGLGLEQATGKRHDDEAESRCKYWGIQFG